MVLALLVLSSGCAAQAIPLTVGTHVDGKAAIQVADHCSMTDDNTVLVLDPRTGQTSKPSTPDGGAFPPDFVPVRAFLCTTETWKIPGSGEWTVALERSAPAGAVAKLAAAYRTATVLESDVSRCHGEFVYPGPRIAFVDAHGKAVWPGPPRDPECLDIVGAVYIAMQATAWTTTDSRKVAQISTTVSCPSAPQDLIALQPEKPAPPGPFFEDRPTDLTVCVYQIKMTGGAFAHPEGVYVRQKALLGNDFTTAMAVLDAAPPAAPCTDTATYFAVIRSGGIPEESYMELDGCRRVEQAGTMPGDVGQGLRQLDQAGVAALTAP